MRKIILQMMTTLNGVLDDPGKWVPDVPKDLYTHIDLLYSKFDTVLVGHTTYKEMYEYWPNAETDSETPVVAKSMARKMNSYKKFVFTKGDVSITPEWHNSEFLIVKNDDELKQFITEIKNQPGADIHLSGGASLAKTFIRLGLIDEYRFFVYPVIAEGQAWFNDIKDQRLMKFQSSVSFRNGVVGLSYKPELVEKMEDIVLKG